MCYESAAARFFIINRTIRVYPREVDVRKTSLGDGETVGKGKRRGEMWGNVGAAILMQ